MSVPPRPLSITDLIVGHADDRCCQVSRRIRGSFGHWVEPKTEKGVTSLGYYTLSALGQAFTSDCYRLGFVFPFDWAAWARTTDGQRPLGEPRGRRDSDPQTSCPGF